MCQPESRVRGAPATVRGAADGGGGHAGMRSERATTTVHRLGHGSLATPRHDVAWTATVWGAMTQIGAIGGAAAAGCGGGSGVGARALDGAGLLACGVCRAAHQYTNRTHLRFLPVSPSSPESENPLCAIAWPVGVRPLPPYTEVPNGASKDGYIGADSSANYQRFCAPSSLVPTRPAPVPSRLPATIHPTGAWSDRTTLLSR